MAGRPREFDRDQALEVAITEFWRHGFDGVTIAGLAGAMGIAVPSLYSAFGDKRALFDEAARRYGERLDESLTADLSITPARAAVEKLLVSAVEHFTRSDTPPGCLVMGEPLLAGRRRQTRSEIASRLGRALRAGELDDRATVKELTDFLDSVLTGMAARARDGATRAELARTVSRAMHAWPQDGDQSADRPID